MNRLTQKTYPDTTAVNYTYDNDSRLTQVSDATGTYQFTFDNMGRLTGTNTQYSFLSTRAFATSYSYDAASNRVGFTDPEGGSTTYAYDALNRLQTLTPPSAFTTGAAAPSFGFSYDALSRRKQMTRPNGVTTNYTYDNLSRLLSVLHQVGGATIDGASYTLDNAGNRTSKTDQLANVTTNYGYDQIYQLLSATQGSTTTESYSYDAVGNRLSALNSSGWTYNASNELTAIPGLPPSGGSYTYDANGNTLTDAQGRTYTWDYENRLTQVVVPATGTVIFKYDPFGRRIYKSSSSAASNFVYDRSGLIEEVDASGAMVARYSHGPNVDEPLAMLRSGTANFYNADGLGSITSLANTSGSVAQTYEFDSYGNLTASSGPLINPFQYTAREFDAETGLYYYRDRYYDQVAGRFLNEDRLGFQGDLYQYANNNPLVWVDPSGNQCFSVTPNGATEVPCVDTKLRWSCVETPTGYSCVPPTPPGPPTPQGVDRSLEILDKIDECLWEEIKEDQKIQADLLNRTLLLNLEVGGTSLGMKGAEAGFESLGWRLLTKVVGAADVAALAYHAVDAAKINIEANQKLKAAKQRSCDCQRRALIK